MHLAKNTKDYVSIVITIVRLIICAFFGGRDCYSNIDNDCDIVVILMIMMMIIIMPSYQHNSNTNNNIIYVVIIVIM